MNILIITENVQESEKIKLVLQNKLNIKLDKNVIILTDDYNLYPILLIYFINLDIIAISFKVLSKNESMLTLIDDINAKYTLRKMNKIKVILFSLLLHIMFLYALELHSQPFTNAYELSYANISTAINGRWSAQRNPATSANNDRFFIGASFANLYGIKKLNYLAALSIVPINNNNFSLSVNTYGIPEYKESTYTIGYGKALSPKFNFGLAFNYHQLRIVDRDGQRAFSVNIGAQYLIIQKLLLGIFLENVTNSKFKNVSTTEKPSSFSLGLSYLLNKKKVKLISEIRKTLGYLTDFAFAIDYNIIEWMHITAGISTTPLKQYYGIRLQVKKIFIDVAYNTNRNITSFPAISMSYLF